MYFVYFRRETFRRPKPGNDRPRVSVKKKPEICRLSLPPPPLDFISLYLSLSLDLLECCGEVIVHCCGY